jgi:hypothetical protein
MGEQIPPHVSFDAAAHDIPDRGHIIGRRGINNAQDNIQAAQP